MRKYGFPCVIILFKNANHKAVYEFSQGKFARETHDKLIAEWKNHLELRQLNLLNPYPLFGFHSAHSYNVISLDDLLDVSYTVR